MTEIDTKVDGWLDDLPDISSNDSDKKPDEINIFDEFNADNSLEKDVEWLNKENNKDMFYYLNFYWKILQILFFTFFLVILFVWGYVYIQKNDKLQSQSFLNPLCFVFMWEIPYSDTNCSSIAYTDIFYKEKLTDLKDTFAEKIIDIMPKVYENESFLRTKEVSFLLDKTTERLNILQVIENFDKLKSSFNWIDKKRLVCNNYSINTEDNIMSVDCKAYSKWYEKSIIGFSWEKTDELLKWTSISVASSFLNYIDKNSDYFSLLDKEKMFSLNPIIWEYGYTKETSFSISLKINN